MRRFFSTCGSTVFAVVFFFCSEAHAADASLDNSADTARKQAILDRFAGKLSDLETQLFIDAADGHFDRFSLLDAALIASGEQRESMLRHYENRLANLLEQLRPLIDPNSPPEKNAERVFDFMHNTVLRGGYRLEATDLRMAFDDGRFNCVSASVLFNCLAEGAGLHCSGLEMPDHTMSRVFLADGFLDLETTCPRWFQERNEPAQPAEAASKTDKKPLKRDYSLLREVTPVQMMAMIYYNRGVDYMTDKRFSEAAAVNAKALRLDPENATARGNFLATLNNWSIDWCASRHYRAAEKLLKEGLAFDKQYPAFQQNFIYLHYQWSDQLCNAGRYAEAIELLKKASEELPEKEYLKQLIEDIDRRWERK